MKQLRGLELPAIGLLENLFAKLKDWRRIAIRYD